ncbi:MAG: glutamine synthetase III, partial [Lentisphaeria bacterium]|nr:glutamine synthetase III [Lentisphaeria bacterium]
MRSNLVFEAAEHNLPISAPMGAAALEHFAEDVFDASKMAAHLSKSTYRKLMATLNGMQPLDPSIADEVASAMKSWAISRGATHYTHWFQPLTGGTAEKHDAFLDFQDDNAIFAFSGNSPTVADSR